MAQCWMYDYLRGTLINNFYLLYDLPSTRSLLGKMYALLSLVGCLVGGVQSQIYPARFDGVTWDDANWRLMTSVLGKSSGGKIRSDL